MRLIVISIKAVIQETLQKVDRLILTLTLNIKTYHKKVTHSCSYYIIAACISYAEVDRERWSLENNPTSSHYKLFFASTSA